MDFKPGDLVFPSHGHRRPPLTFIGYQEQPHERRHHPRKVMISGPYDLVYHVDERDIVDAKTHFQNKAETEAKVRRDIKWFLCAFPIFLGGIFLTVWLLH